MRTLLVDADIVAYKASVKFQNEVDFGMGPVVDTDPKGMQEFIDDTIEFYIDEMEADRAIICLTDKVNFRKKVCPMYKMNRKATVKPVMLQDAKDYMSNKWDSFMRPTLEADDVMGILSTHPTYLPGEKIIISEDKDMQTIPGLLYNPGKPDLGYRNISELDADRYFLLQTMIGDATDGYKGVEGVGPKHIFSRLIMKADREDLWDIVMAAFKTKFKGPAVRKEAVKQARMARILRSCDYDLEKSKVKLFNPKLLLTGSSV